MTKRICTAPDIDLKATGRRIKQLRQDHNYTVLEVSIYAGVSQAAVYSWENGTNLPDLSNLLGLQFLYKLKSLNDLLVLTKPMC